MEGLDRGYRSLLRVVIDGKVRDWRFFVGILEMAATEIEVSERNGGELDSMILGGRERIVTAVRCRPMSYKELREDDRPIVLVDDEDEEKQGEVIILDPTYFSRKRDYERSFFERSFRYDHSFLPDSTQEDIYEAIGKPLLKHSFEGYNSCLFV